MNPLRRAVYAKVVQFFLCQDEGSSLQKQLERNENFKGFRAFCVRPFLY